MQEYGRARSVFHAAVGKNHVYSALVVRNMAIMCDSLGKLDEAIAYYKEALDIYKYTVGRESADFAEVPHRGIQNRLMFLCSRAMGGPYEQFQRAHAAEEV